MTTFLGLCLVSALRTRAALEGREGTTHIERFYSGPFFCGQKTKKDASFCQHPHFLNRTAWRIFATRCNWLACFTPSITLGTQIICEPHFAPFPIGGLPQLFCRAEASEFALQVPSWAGMGQTARQLASCFGDKRPLGLSALNSTDRETCGGISVRLLG